MPRKLILILSLSLLVTSAWATDYYVLASVTSSGDGSMASPFKTIQEAADVMVAGDVCYIGTGTYRENITPANSGTAANPIVYTTWDNADVVITGINLIDAGAWVSEGGNLYSTSVVMNKGKENQVFQADTMMHLARWPNPGAEILDKSVSVMDAGTSSTSIVDASLPAYDYTGAEVWVHASRYWTNWTTDVTSYSSGVLNIINYAPYTGAIEHKATNGAEYFVFNFLDGLDTEEEWYYDESEQKLYVYRTSAPGGNVGYKQRLRAFNLINRSYITIEDITILGATVNMNESSNYLTFDGVTIKYSYHSSRANSASGFQSELGVVVKGEGCVFKNCEIAYTSANGLLLLGKDNLVVNSYIHDCNYIGSNASGIHLRGEGNVVSHSTLSRSGGSVLNYANMYKSLVQYCELSEAGMLTRDVGLTYGGVVEAGNSEIRYNWLHDNLAESHNMGMYFDHGMQNIITHHNVVWDVDDAALIINHYANFHLVYNNTFSVTDTIAYSSWWGNQYVPDMYGSRIENNIFNEGTRDSADNYVWENNFLFYSGLSSNRYLTAGSAAIDTGILILDINEDFSGTAPDLGAYEFGASWQPGHNFSIEVTPDLTRSYPIHRNLIENSAFEHENHIAPWTQNAGTVSSLDLTFVKGQGSVDTLEARMGRYSLKLGAGGEAGQTVDEIRSGGWYEFSAALRVEGGDQVVLGIRSDSEETIYSDTLSGSAPYWERLILPFQAGASVTSLEVFVKHISGSGDVFVDDTGLILIVDSVASDSVILRKSESDSIETPIEKGMNGSVSIFPNPATSSVQVYVPEVHSSGFKVTVFNASGQALISEQMKDTSNQLDVSNLKIGVYLMVIEKEHERISRKLIVR